MSLSGDESVYDFARFAADGRSLVVGSRDGWVRVWSTRTGRPASRQFGGHAGPVVWGSVSSDGRRLASGSTDGTVRLWDLPTQRAVGAALPGVPNSTVHPQFTADGRHLFAVTNAGRAFRWDVRPSRWAQHACAVAGRPLSRSEWREGAAGPRLRARLRELTPARHRRRLEPPRRVRASPGDHGFSENGG